MLLKIFGVALIVGVCMLMAFGEEANWVRGGLRNLGMFALFGVIGLVVAGFIAYVY
jgi:hypothetical protein